MTDDERRRPDSLSEMTSLKMSPWLKQQIERECGYGTTKSEWIREACRQRLNAEAGDETPAAQAKE